MPAQSDPLRARLGSHGRAVHALAQHSLWPPVPPGTCCWYWGVSLCGRWAGEVRMTEDPVTCGECRRRMR